MTQYIYWTTEQKGPWKCIADTPEAREQAIQHGAMFFTNTSLSRPWENSGTPEPRRRGDFCVDFDGPGAIQNARDLFLVHLPDLYGADPYECRFFMSGQKGVHVEVPSVCFGAADGDPLLPKVYKRIAAELKAMFNLDTLDMAVYNMKRGRMWRLPNVKRSNGRYKAPLTLEEFRDLAESDLVELTKAPREIDIIDDSPPEVCPDLKMLFDDAKAFVYKEKAERGDADTLTEEEKARISKAIPPCVKYILTTCPITDNTNFNKLVLNLVKYFITAGYDEQRSIELVKPFLEKYPHSETYTTPEKRSQHWRELWLYLSGNNDASFQCSYMKGMGFPGNAFHCSKCIGKETDSLTFPPLILEKTQINRVLLKEPPEAESFLTYNDSPVLTRGVVGGITASGGTGKTMFLQQLAHAMADGAGFGPLKAAGRFRVLMLCGEDPQEEVHRRLWRIGKGDFPDGLCVASTAGQLPPLMHLVEGNPQRSPAYDWLKTTIENHMPLDVLILDPKSRFYGLDENNNDHATQWIACLEALTIEHNLTVLFSHHVSKQRADTMGQAASRGASAIVDGARWMAGMTKLSDESAKRYDISGPRDYIEFDITKNNYAAQLPAKFIFRRTENGLLEYAALEAERRNTIKKELYGAIRASDKKFSRRDLIKNEHGAVAILTGIQDEFPSFKRTELDSLVDELISDGVMEEIKQKSGKAGSPKKVLKAIPRDLNNLSQKW